MQSCAAAARASAPACRLCCPLPAAAGPDTLRPLAGPAASICAPATASALPAPALADGGRAGSAAAAPAASPPPFRQELRARYSLAESPCSDSCAPPPRLDGSPASPARLQLTAAVRCSRPLPVRALRHLPGGQELKVRTAAPGRGACVRRRHVSNEACCAAVPQVHGSHRHLPAPRGGQQHGGPTAAADVVPHAAEHHSRDARSARREHQRQARHTPLPDADQRSACGVDPLLSLAGRRSRPPWRG